MSDIINENCTYKLCKGRIYGRAVVLNCSSISVFSIFLSCIKCAWSALAQTKSQNRITCHAHLL